MYHWLQFLQILILFLAASSAEKEIAAQELSYLQILQRAKFIEQILKSILIQFSLCDIQYC